MNLGYLITSSIFTLIGLTMIRPYQRALGQQLSTWLQAVILFIAYLIILNAALYHQFFLLMAPLLILINMLLPLALIDWQWLILPNAITYFGIGLGLLLNCFMLLTSPLSALLGCILGYGSLWLIRRGHQRLTGKLAMGGGDLKLLAMIGAWLGWQALPSIVFLGSILGIIAGSLRLLRKTNHYQQPFAFGPYLIIATTVLSIYVFRL